MLEDDDNDFDLDLDLDLDLELESKPGSAPTAPVPARLGSPAQPAQQAPANQIPSGSKFRVRQPEPPQQTQQQGSEEQQRVPPAAAFKHHQPATLPPPLQPPGDQHPQPEQHPRPYEQPLTPPSQPPPQAQMRRPPQQSPVPPSQEFESAPPRQVPERNRIDERPFPETPLEPLPLPPERSPLGKLLVIGIPITLVFAIIFAAIKIFGGGGDPDPTPNSNGDRDGSREINDSPTPPTSPGTIPKGETPSTPPTTVGSESDTTEHRNARAERALKGFFGATKPVELLRYVRHPKRVAPLMNDYYSRKPFENLQFLGLNQELENFELAGSNFWTAEADNGGPASKTMILEDTPEGFKVDWEYFVEYSPMAWSTYTNEAPEGPIDFRVLANQVADFRAPHFNDPDRYISVQLMTLADQSEIIGYAERDSELGKRLQKFLANQFEQFCILRLQFPRGSKTGDTAVHIRELVNPHWVITDVPESK